MGPLGESPAPRFSPPAPPLYPSVARAPGRDILDCGAGRDVGEVSRADRVRDCERVMRT